MSKFNQSYSLEDEREILRRWNGINSAFNIARDLDRTPCGIIGKYYSMMRGTGDVLCEEDIDPAYISISPSSKKTVVIKVSTDYKIEFDGVRD
jgi:hypothetical protein